MASKGENTKDTHTEDSDKPEKNKEEANNVKEDKKDKEATKDNSDANAKDAKKDTEVDSNSTKAMKEATSNKKTEKEAESNDDKEQKKTTDTKDVTKVSIPNGKGTPLGEIPRVDASISRFKNEDLKLLHQFLFEIPGKTTIIKKNIKKFNGFDFAKGTDEYKAKLEGAEEFEVKQLKSICEMLDLEKRGSKDEIAERIMEFLLDPKDSGKVDGGGRPKRSAAVKANNRGYSSHDESYSSDERPSPRSRRDKGKRPNLKEESSSESDADFHLSDTSEEKPRVRRRGVQKKKPSEDEEESVPEEAADSFEESDVEVKSKKRKPAASPTKATPVKGRGRKPANATPSPNKRKTPARGGAKKPQSESNESDSSEDEPLIKKTKNADPPTDEEIKSYVKDILDGANLEEITMKTVCKQVYAHYPDFDLTHKKDYIKTTVKSLIST